MRVSNSCRIAGVAVAALTAAAALAGVAAPAQAQSLIPGVTGCGASGDKQAGGAVVGALAGGLLGNSVSGHNRTTGTLVGAAVGAAAGSAVGCQMQHNDEQRAEAAAATQNREAAQAYRHDEPRLASGVAPASYEERDDELIASRTVTLRAAPDVASGRVGRLHRGERFEALAQVRGANWVLVGRDGVGVGYVQDYYTRPAPDGGQRYAEQR
jgi:hypothetical protein